MRYRPPPGQQLTTSVFITNMATDGSSYACCLGLYLIMLVSTVGCTCCQKPDSYSLRAITVLADHFLKRDSNGTMILYTATPYELYLVGDISNFSCIFFTTKTLEDNDSDSKIVETRMWSIQKTDMTDVMTVRMVFESATENNYHACLCRSESCNGTRVQNSTRAKCYHQGSKLLVRLKVNKDKYLMPLSVQVIFILFLLCLSGLFSGLNLGLMTLDKTELRIIQRCGSEDEKKYAQIIQPLREKGNFLLCSLVLGNVLVNNTLTILLDNLTSGVYAIIGATVGIVIFGEIVPQAICSRYGLAIGARTALITRLFMLITFPLSYPISKILDRILGEEIGRAYNRDKLQHLIRLAKDLKNEEVDIISGALALTKKTVRDAMTEIDNVYMMDVNAILTFESMAEAMERGYTRVPVYEGNRNNIVSILNIKDLALVDPDDRTPLRALCKYYNHHVQFVFDDNKLDSLLQDFKEGRSHIAIVQRVNNEGEGDPYYETVGVITLEDVIEELIQSEIIDETDTLIDNKYRKPRYLERKDFTIFNQPDKSFLPSISPQLALAALQFLSTSVEPFQSEYVSELVLKRLLKKDIVRKLNISELSDEQTFLYQKGKPADYFILLLEGRVEVIVGNDQMKFECGPFSYFGVKPFMGIHVEEMTTQSNSSGSDHFPTKTEQHSPDFSLQATTNLQYIQISLQYYINACRATLISRNQLDVQSSTMEDGVQSSAIEEAFKNEWSTTNTVDIENTLTTEATRTRKNHMTSRTDNVDQISVLSHGPPPSLTTSLPTNDQDNNNAADSLMQIDIVTDNSDSVKLLTAHEVTDSSSSVDNTVTAVYRGRTYAEPKAEGEIAPLFSKI